MRQQLRLRVLVPVAVLGLLGAGFGAFAMGGPEAPVSIPVARATSSGAVDTGAVDTGAVDTGAVDTGPAPAPPPPPQPTAGEVDAATWAQQANALCLQLDEQVQALGEFQSPNEAKEWLAQALELLHAFEDDFVAIGWPPGEQNAVVALHVSHTAAIGLVEELQAALEAEDVDELIRLTKEKPGEPAAVKAYKAELRRLGAGECAKSSPADTAPLRASAALQWQLMKYRAVVVVFASPDSVVDNGAVFEARAAALDTGAGFVAVDVTDEKQVAAIAIGYEVLESPTVLVVTRGPKLRSEFKGFVDQQTVAQAVTNALK
jgi:hypothetical protein